MKNIFQIALIGILMTTTSQSSCSSRMSNQSAQMESTYPADRSESSSQKQLLETVEQFASSDERASTSAWQVLQTHDRSKLIADLTKISDASAPDDRKRVLIAFTYCKLGHEYASNRKIVISALSKQPPFKNLYGDWAASLVRRLMIQGDHDLLALLFEVSDWSDGAMSQELARAYSQALATDPDTFLRFLSSQSATRTRVIKLLKYNSLTADENTKVLPQECVAPIHVTSPRRTNDERADEWWLIG